MIYHKHQFLTNAIALEKQQTTRKWRWKIPPEMAPFKLAKNNVDAKIVFRLHIDHTQWLGVRRRYSNKSPSFMEHYSE